MNIQVYEKLANKLETILTRITGDAVIEVLTQVQINDVPLDHLTSDEVEAISDDDRIEIGIEVIRWSTQTVEEQNASGFAEVAVALELRRWGLYAKTGDGNGDGTCITCFLLAPSNESLTQLGTEEIKTEDN